MKDQSLFQLNLCYYGMLVLALLAGVTAYLLVMRDIVAPIAVLSPLGRGIQYAVIMDAMCTIPLGLYWHKHRCEKLSHEPDPVIQQQGYRRSATTRIILVSNSMVFGIAAFYLLGAYQSMLWITAIAAIGWYFTKPTERKRTLELQPKSEQDETY